MKRCFYCKEFVADDSIKCSNCGRWFNEMDIQSFVAKKKKGISVEWSGGMFLYICVSMMISVSSAYFVNLGKITNAQFLENYYATFAALDILFIILIGMINLTGAIAMLCLGKRAFNLFLTGLILNVLINSWIVFGRGVMSINGKVLFALLIVAGIIVGIRLYMLSEESRQQD